MANVIMSAIDRWFSGLQPALVPRLPTGPDDPNQQLHKLINNAFVHPKQHWMGTLSTSPSFTTLENVHSWVLQDLPTGRMA
jgi:hypothetical protein